MKKVVCFLLCACAGCLFGCDSDEKSWDDVCEAIFFNEINQADLNKLDKDRVAQVRDVYIEACANLYGGMPNCSNEFLEYYKCAYIDNTSEYWEEQNRLEDECYENYSTDAEETACIDKLNQACRSLEITNDACWKKNESAIEAYMSSSEEGSYLKLKALFDSWGLDIEEYMGEFEG